MPVTGWIGTPVHASVYRSVTMDVTANGVTALLADSEVRWLSDPVRYEELMRQTNTQLQTGLLPVPASGALA